MNFTLSSSKNSGKLWDTPYAPVSLTSFIQKKIPKDWNSTLICLIPKVAKPESAHQFRPIGLCNTLYKVVSKILIHKLKLHLNDIIHPLQASFIPGRKASDNILLA